MNHFQLDPKLAQDSIEVKHLSLCQLRLMNDSRFPWIILIPVIPLAREFFDLKSDDQKKLWQEVTTISEWAQQFFHADKMNIALLGNIVAQLHVHIIARKFTDKLWPEPIWGQGESLPYESSKLQKLVQDIKRSLP